MNIQLNFSDTDLNFTGPVLVTSLTSPQAARVDYFVDNVFKVSRTTPDFPWTWNTVEVEDGSHSVKAVAYHKNGRTYTALKNVIVTNAEEPDPDSTPPTVPGTFAKNSSTDTTITVTWVASTDDVGVVNYNLYRNNVFVASVDDALTTYTFVGLTCGTTYSLSIEASDAAGNKSAKSTINAATSVCPAPDPEPAPPVFATNIENGQVITLPFTWTASVSPQPDSVQFWADGVLLEQDSTSPFSHTFNLAPGAHQLGLCAWHGTTRTCHSPLGSGVFANIIVESPPVAPTFNTNISDGQNITIPFTWTASVSPQPDSVQFWADGVLLKQDAASPFSHDLTLDAGSHALGLCAWHGSTRTCHAPLGGGVFANVTVSGSLPPSEYTKRFATFNPSTDDINGTFNKYSPAGYWWVPGQTPPGGTWPSGGGLHEISTPHGPGIDIVVTQEMDYVGATPLGGWDLSRFAGLHDINYDFRGEEQVWEWTWMWPSSGNPSGWANTWVTAEGLTFPTLTPTGNSIVGHHLYLHYANPLTLRFGRNTHASSDPAQQAWQFYIASNSGVTFPANTYQHMRLEIFWTENSNGYIKVYTRNEGGSEVQWVNYSGVTLPLNWRPRSMYANLRKISTHPRNQLHWINHRMTVL